MAQAEATARHERRRQRHDTRRGGGGASWGGGGGVSWAAAAARAEAVAVGRRPEGRQRGGAGPTGGCWTQV
jgi:hypothetical protein